MAKRKRSKTPVRETRESDDAPDGGALLEGLDSDSVAVTRHDLLATIHTIRGKLAQVAQCYWDVGDALRRIHDRKLYGLLGYVTFDAFLIGELPAIASQAEKMITVCRTYVRQDTAGLGLEKARILVTYANARKDGVDPGELVRSDAPVGGKPISAASVRDIRQAIRELREAAVVAQKPTAAQRATNARRKAVVKALGRSLREAGLGKGEIIVKGDRVTIAFGLDAVARKLLPPDEG